MPKGTPKQTNDPWHALHLTFLRMRRKENRSFKSYEGTPEEWMLILSRRYANKQMKEYKKVYKARSRSSFRLHEKLPWPVIQEGYTKYWYTMKRGRDIEPTETLAGLRETAKYYSRVMYKDLDKRRKHPHINPQRLGMDPRTRKWPSGKIEYSLTYIPRGDSDE